MQLLRSYSLPINCPLSVPPVLFDLLFRLPWLQDMKVRVFVCSLKALHRLIFLPTCPYKACTVRGCLSSHSLWIEASRRTHCPLLFGDLQMNNEPSQTNQPNQTSNPTGHQTNCRISISIHCGLWTCVLFLSMKYAEIPNLWQNWPKWVQYIAEQSWWCMAEMPVNYPFSADFPFLLLKIKAKFRRYELVQSRTRREALLCLQTPHYTSKSCRCPSTNSPCFPMP